MAALSKMSLDSWHQALLGLHLLGQDKALGGMVIRARAGPVRDLLMETVADLPGPLRKIHPGIGDEELFGGLDLPATLAQGEMVVKSGLLDAPCTLILTMGERCTPGLAARLATALDASTHRLIILDEGVDDEATPQALIERLAFHVDLSDTAIGDTPSLEFQTISATQVDPRQVTQIAADLGIDSLRAPRFALIAARLLDDVELACTLTLAHKATRFPEPAEAEPEQQDPQPQTEDKQDITLPDEMILEAIRALLPDDLLDQIAARKARTGKGSGSGAAKKGNRRGRPLPARAGRLGDGARIDLISTLRAAAPWQTIRKQATGQDRLHIRQSDIHVKRYEEKTDRVLIFTVDASGSAALARLAEAKGAVELLLAQAYARRDHVSLIAFRGTDAELLLPPTRSLVQTKRRLAGLPGGGGTPLAAGMKEALSQALLAQQRGLTPTVVMLTDGRANIALDGQANRPQAADDATQMAQSMRIQGIDALVIDTGNRPEKALKSLAQTLGAPYLPMPRANAERLAASVSTALAP